MPEPIKPFDAATKRLLESDPVAWLRLANLPGDEAEFVDANLTTITADADRILHVQTPEYFAHFELQASYKVDMDERTFLYNAVAHVKYHLPVFSVVFLLRKEADGPAITGRVAYSVPDCPGSKMEFTYRIVRVWELKPEEMLNGPLATLPLTPLTNVSAKALPEVVRKMEARIEAEASEAEKGMLWTTTFLLLGLKYKRERVYQLLKGVLTMHESDTYMAILEEGEARGEAKFRTDEARRILLRQGTKRFGEPNAQTRAALETITALEPLEQLADRILEVESWQELLK